MKTKLLLLAFILTTSFAKASHLMGGEITWTSPGNGQFVFHLKLYRDCNGTVILPNGIFLDVHNHPTLDSIPMHYLSTTDLSPKCDSTSLLQISCATSFGLSLGVVEELVFISDTIFLTGIPPTAGWVFSFGSCCRAGSVANLPNPSSLGITLWAKMFSFLGQDVSSYSDNSPYFAELAPTITCMGSPYSYNPITIDTDQDSLVHSWVKPLDMWNGGNWNASNPPPVIYSNGYNYMNQFPDSLIDSSNIAATIDPATGEITLTSYTVGLFVSTIGATAYKCGVKVAEICRDFPLIIVPCSQNNVPIV